ncbi:hypothetical protein LCM23_12135 [Cytobacillus kochii]|uniref:hypothetical protein n=1 Tax=Cytobacillus kochii TaxID=859143 RepID=UPI001CD4724D|nr:hypothetical protein [Cytobacillus kochii]MCA1026843.1 hypothetical protein [Cytobacillus kochii]
MEASDPKKTKKRDTTGSFYYVYNIFRCLPFNIYKDFNHSLDVIQQPSEQNEEPNRTKKHL